MPRPGCVWSHVVLIELADLAQLVDLGELRRCFKRPSRTSEQMRYDPLSLVPRRNSAAPIATSLEADGLQILAALYAKPQTPAVIEAPSSETYTDLVFALWTQQWPRLRRNFRFSTGSFADRGRSGVPFDLQIAPAANRRAWQREETQPSLESANTSTDLLQPPTHNWLRLAVDDLLNPDISTLRSFFREYGSDVDNPRESFARLASASNRLKLHPTDDWVERLRYIGELFPKSTEAQHLKESLITLHDLPESEQTFDRVWATVSFLLTADESSAYSGLTPDYAGIATKLWQSGKTEVLSLLAQLVRRQENPSAAAFASAVASLIQPSELSLISRERPELVPLVLSRRPSLAVHLETWQLPTNTQWRIYEILDGLPLDPKNWAQIMGAMFLAGTTVAIRDAVRRAGPYAIDGAFRWLDSTLVNEWLPSQIWREALTQAAADRLRNIERLSAAELAFCSWLIPPEVARQVLTTARKDFRDLAQQPLEVVPKPLRVHTAFLLVTLGLRAGDIEAVSFVARGFFTVHDALALDQDLPESWSLLSPLLPRFAYWRQWDRCEQLRRAVRRRFPKHSEMPTALLQAAQTPEHVEIVNLVYPRIIMKRLRASRSAKPPVLSSAPRVFWEFKRDQIEQQDFSDFLNHFGELASGDVLRDSQASFTFFVGGFDDDAREVTEIPEIRAFYHKFYEVWPHWMFFVEPDSLKTMAFCIFKTYMCIHDEKKRVVQHAYDDTEMAEFIKQQTPDFMSLCHRAGIDSIETNEILEGITKELMPPGWKKASGIKVS